MAFGSEIKRLREDVPISASKLAGLIGIDAGRLRKWEQKDLNPRLGDTKKIEDFFGMDIKAVQSLKSIKKFLNVPIRTNENKHGDDKVKFSLDTNTLIKELIRENRQNKATVNIIKITVAKLLSISSGEKVERELVQLERTIDKEADRLFELDKKRFGQI